MCGHTYTHTYTHTYIHTYIHTHRTTTVTLATHARRGLINAGSQIEAGGVARTRVRLYIHVRDNLWPHAFYHSTATVQTTHARLFVAVAALAPHAARCLTSIKSLINLTLVQYVQELNKRRPRLDAGLV